ncbi:phosphatase PAP2 family protein [Georgenia sp. AZ-5]|uniref:phosphatase PAP2 family protein n=1 Tax=Georgenia sp. AZ-5 TaxID=3367526 RepID=UPI00375424AA
MTQTQTRTPQARPVTRRRIAGAALAALAGAGVLAVWWFFVTTVPGQHVDEVAYIGSRIGRGRVAEYTQAILDVVSVPFLLLVIVVTTVVAALRRRWRQALGVGAMVGAMNVTTQLLKYQVLTRPDLGVTQGYQENTLPSGHTTVAGSVAAAMLLVAPSSSRWLVALLGAAYTGATGLATMADGWHRASDVVAAVLVVAAWALLAQAVAGPTAEAGPTRTAAALLALVGVVGGIVAAASMLLTRGASLEPSRAEMLIAYGGASAGVLATVALATLAVLVVGTRPR